MFIVLIAYVILKGISHSNKQTFLISYKSYIFKVMKQLNTIWSQYLYIYNWKYIAFSVIKNWMFSINYAFLLWLIARLLDLSLLPQEVVVSYCLKIYIENLWDFILWRSLTHTLFYGRVHKKYESRSLQWVHRNQRRRQYNNKTSFNL